MKTALSSFELCVYFLGWIAANLYSLSLLYTEQNDILYKNREYIPYLRDLRSGWKYLERLQDDSDVEWSSFKYYIRISWSYMILQFLVTEVIRRNKNDFTKHWYIISSMVYVAFCLGWKQLALIFIQPLIYLCVIFGGGKHTPIWVTSILLLGSYNTLKFKYFFWQILDHDNLQDEEVYLFMGCVAWIELRCISFCLDYIEKKESYETPKSRTILDMLSYVLYLPVLYMGPVILYESFQKSFTANPEKLSKRIRSFVYDALLFFIYSIALEVSLYYIVFYALHERIELVQKFSVIALGGGGLWMGLHFYLKYVITYGLNAALARLDHIDPPPTPRCIARIHVYSHMWRYFDVGLYQFLVKYIYKPSYQAISLRFNLSKLAVKFLASLTTFIFIFIWHGTTKQIFVWSLLNYLGITLETLGKCIHETEKYNWFKTKVLRSDAMETRFKALLCTPLLVLSAVSNFYLFAGSEVGDLYFQCFTKPNMYGVLTICSAMYCCCQVSMAVQDVPSRTDTKKKTVSKLRSEDFKNLSVKE